MCGILALFGEEVETASYALSHRGPDDYCTKTLGRCKMDFYRLAINDLTSAGMQPFKQGKHMFCLLYTSPSPRDQRGSRMPSSA